MKDESLKSFRAKHGNHANLASATIHPETAEEDQREAFGGDVQGDGEADEGEAGVRGGCKPRFGGAWLHTRHNDGILANILVGSSEEAKTYHHEQLQHQPRGNQLRNGVVYDLVYRNYYILHGDEGDRGTLPKCRRLHTLISNSTILPLHISTDRRAFKSSSCYLIGRQVDKLES